jgi:hypothetical protein
MMFNFFCSLATSAAEITFDMEALLCHLRLTTLPELHQALYFRESSTPIAHLCKGNQKLYEAHRAMSKPDAEVYNLKGEQLLHYCQFWDIPTNDPRIPRAIGEAQSHWVSIRTGDGLPETRKCLCTVGLPSASPLHILFNYYSQHRPHSHPAESSIFSGRHNAFFVGSTVHFERSKWKV